MSPDASSFAGSQASAIFAAAGVIGTPLVIARRGRDHAVAPVFRDHGNPIAGQGRWPRAAFGALRCRPRRLPRRGPARKARFAPSSNAASDSQTPNNVRLKFDPSCLSSLLLRHYFFAVRLL